MNPFDVGEDFSDLRTNPFDVGEDFSDLRTNPFEDGEYDKDHRVPNVPTESITRSKAKKIQQAFILHLQNWIGSV